MMKRSTQWGSRYHAVNQELEPPRQRLERQVICCTSVEPESILLMEEIRRSPPGMYKTFL